MKVLITLCLALCVHHVIAQSAPKKLDGRVPQGNKDITSPPAQTRANGNGGNQNNASQQQQQINYQRKSNQMQQFNGQQQGNGQTIQPASERKQVNQNLPPYNQNQNSPNHQLQNGQNVNVTPQTHETNLQNNQPLRPTQQQQFSNNQHRQWQWSERKEWHERKNSKGQVERKEYTSSQVRGMPPPSFKIPGFFGPPQGPPQAPFSALAHGAPKLNPGGNFRIAPIDLQGLLRGEPVAINAFGGFVV